LGTFNVILLVLNVVLFILVTGKIAQFYNLYQDNLRVQNNIENLVEQNSQLANLILDELEGKLQEAQKVLGGLDAQLAAVPVREPEKLFDISPAQLSPILKTKEDLNPEAFFDLNGAARSKITYLRQMGMSVQEIAEKLQMSQGEIDLKLNLQEKHSSTTRKLRKLK